MARIADGPSTQQRREQILDAAMQVFSEKGYHAATTKEIADLVGVTPPLLYSYFPSKRDLLAAVVVERGSIAADASILENDGAGTGPRDQLYRWSMDLVRRIYAAADSPAFRVMAMEGMHDEEVGSVFNAEMERLKAPLVQYLRRLSDEGKFRSADADMVADVCLHALSGIALHEAQRAKKVRDIAPEDLVAATVDLLLHGLAMPGMVAEPVPHNSA